MDKLIKIKSAIKIDGNELIDLVDLKKNNKVLDSITTVRKNKGIDKWSDRGSLLNIVSEKLKNFYNSTVIYHTNENLQVQGVIIPLGYVGDGTEDYLDIFYNKNEKNFECLGSTSKFFNEYKEILKLNNVLCEYCPKDTKINVKELLNNISVGTYISEQTYHRINDIFEKFSHSIDLDNNYGTEENPSKKRMFKVWENGNNGGITRELDIVITYGDLGPKFFVDYINNNSPVGKLIKYEEPYGWHDYPYESIGEFIELELHSNQVVAKAEYQWDRKTDISKLKDYQKLNIINYCDFNLFKEGDKYRLEDSQKGNLGNIEDEIFDNLDNIIERLDVYIYDYYFRDIED